MNGLDSLAFEYDTIFISMIFNTFSKEEGLALLNKLVKQMKKNLYFIIEEEFPQNIWTLQDFKDFDLSFFNLGQSQQKLIKIYPSSAVSEVRPLEWSTCHQSLSILYVLPHRNLTGGLKMLYEQIETVDMNPFEAMEALGANKIQSFATSVVPQVLPSYLSICLYNFEINVRNAAILGYVGAGGIGLILDEQFGWRSYERAGIILFMLFITVVLIESISRYLRERLA